ncbi:hypothetical protein [Psychromonas ossibalaenae]|uniref:hypothetical protein n=1 Tax=Psychromonas ossibalaenae TaxID=444922 RepID=UPI0003635018|nr:hypothetical protein [Psychromonas ossibalaenae]
MYDFIETLILRDQAAEELFFEAMEDKLKQQAKADRRKVKPRGEVHVYIDDKDHKYYFHPH